MTGGAGFIGSHLVDNLMAQNYEVIVIDNLSGGDIKNIERWIDNDKFQFIKADIAEYDSIRDAFRGVHAVFHFAANPDVRIGSKNPNAIWRDNVLGTYNVLEAMRENNIKYIIFASSSTVYGERNKIPTPETAILEPISVYGASKLMGEALISGYSYTFKMYSLILRFANIIGPRLRHGVIYDFIMKLKRNPNKLEILGDGTQRKSYLHVSDAVNATLFLFNKILNDAKERVNVLNVGSEDWITVKEIAEIVAETMNLKPKFIYTGGVEGGRGWVGDVKIMLLDINKLKSLGWIPKMNSRQAVERAAQEIYSELK